MPVFFWMLGFFMPTAKHFWLSSRNARLFPWPSTDVHACTDVHSLTAIQDCTGYGLCYQFGYLFSQGEEISLIVD